jgi:hypothetical protein
MSQFLTDKTTPHFKLGKSAQFTSDSFDFACFVSYRLDGSCRVPFQQPRVSEIRGAGAVFTLIIVPLARSSIPAEQPHSQYKGPYLLAPAADGPLYM